MAGMNLEVFKFGMYVMFPIGIMFYFGTNLDNRFSVPGFWPRGDECNQVPRDRDEVVAEYQKLIRRQKFRQEQQRLQQGLPPNQDN